MKGKVHHITSYKIILTIMVVTTIGGIIVWKSKSTSTTMIALLQEPIVDSTPKTSEDNKVINRANKIPTPITDNYGNPSSWLVFNENYQSPYRRFRFKYPSTLKATDNESAPVWLLKNREVLLRINEDHNLHLAGSSSVKNAREQFENYYASLKRRNSTLPELITIERIDFDENRFVYKFTKADSMKIFPIGTVGAITKQDEWDHYLGILEEGNGISVYDLKKLPEDVVLEIIQSIEFK